MTARASGMALVARACRDSVVADAWPAIERRALRVARRHRLDPGDMLSEAGWVAARAAEVYRGGLAFADFVEPYLGRFLAIRAGRRGGTLPFSELDAADGTPFDPAAPEPGGPPRAAFAARDFAALDRALHRLPTDEAAALHLRFGMAPWARVYAPRLARRPGGLAEAEGRAMRRLRANFGADQPDSPAGPTFARQVPGDNRGPR